MIKFILNKIKRLKEINFRFDMPQKKKILQYDELNSNILKLSIKKDFNILPRHKPEIYFWIFLRQIIFFDFSFKTYLKNYIKYTSTKIVINLIDNDLSYYSFYPINNYLENDVKFISIQNGNRIKNSPMFKKKTHRNLKCDHIFLFNKYYKQEYKKIINSNYHVLGSLRNNMVKIKKSQFKNSFLFISSYKKHIPIDKYMHDFYHLLSSYLSNSNRKLNILLRQKNVLNQNDEKEFYKFFFNSNCTFHVSSKWRENYKILDKFENIIVTDSTLGSEAIARRKKVAIFSEKEFKSKKPFGWPAKIKKKFYFFLAREMNSYEIKRVLNNVYYCNQKLWEKKYYQMIKDHMHYDFNNTALIKIINDILNNSKYN